MIRFCLGSAHARCLAEAFALLAGKAELERSSGGGFDGSPRIPRQIPGAKHRQALLFSTEPVCVCICISTQGNGDRLVSARSALTR
jgi:hypothetical protein